jgi:hypothetical protein
MGIQETRGDDIHVALEYLEDSLVRIDPAPLVAGHYAGRGELASF